MGRITETIRCMVRLTDSAILEVAIRCSSAFSRLTDALKAEIKRQTIEQPKRASGRSFASVVTRKRPSLNRARIAKDPPHYPIPTYRVYDRFARPLRIGRLGASVQTCGIGR